MKASLILAMILTAAVAARPTRSPVVPFESPGNPTAQSRIDALVFHKLKQIGDSTGPPLFRCRVRPPRLSGRDRHDPHRARGPRVPRRPQPEETPRAHRSPARSGEEFADYWAMKWCDLLRVKSEFPINLWPNAVQAYHRWIRGCIKENMPYDRFVREMLTASGSNFDVPQVNFYRAVQNREPTAIAQAVALAFMGVRPAGWPKEQMVADGGLLLADRL